MRISQHDPQSGETVMELLGGKLRAQVVKQIKGENFKTTTPTAVIGVVGTIFLTDATPKLTRVWSVQGDVTVHNIDPNVPGEVVLHAGQTTSVAQGKPPSTPTMAPAQEVQTEMSQTSVQEGAVAGAGGAGGEAATSGGTTGGGGVGGLGGGLNLGALGAAGAGAVAGAVGIKKISDTQDTVKSAQSHLSDAASAAAQAAAEAAAAQKAANQAISNTQQLNNINTTIQNTINAILQGCGCVSPTVP